MLIHDVTYIGKKVNDVSAWSKVGPLLAKGGTENREHMLYIHDRHSKRLLLLTPSCYITDTARGYYY